VTRPGDGDAENAAREDALRAADAYRRRFGQAVGTWEFLGHPRELRAALDEAVRTGEPVTAADLYRRLGVAPPPPGAIL
jgi:hypothetical protein